MILFVPRPANAAVVHGRQLRFMERHGNGDVAGASLIRNSGLAPLAVAPRRPGFAVATARGYYHHVRAGRSVPIRPWSFFTLAL